MPKPSAPSCVLLNADALGAADRQTHQDRVGAEEREGKQRRQHPKGEDVRMHLDRESAVDGKRQGQFAAGGKQRARELVIRQGEGEEHGRKHAREDQWEGNLAEGARRRDAERPGGFLHTRIEPVENRKHDEEGEREGVDDMQHEGRAPPVPVDAEGIGDKRRAEADEHARHHHAENDQIEDDARAAELAAKGLGGHDAEHGRDDHRHQCQQKRADQRLIDRQRRDARGRRQPEEMPIPIGRPFDDRKLRTALGTGLERQDRQDDERPIEENQKEGRIDAQAKLDAAGIHDQSSFLRSTTLSRAATTAPMMIVRTTPATAAKAHFSEPTWVTMILPSRLTLRPDRAADVANSPRTMTETKIAPTTTPGMESGRMIVRKMRQKPAPRS
ncbi:hypothetical protein RHSP_81413 [Rhizobium freirei PRF 81]|uniref:Uncharacterized protein n=1 Tax=Rhizobium freirei PRF 81 TaxID=363754 RepID=N6UE86_9HYPH|nr:hypothetical protein RHSP_81413 [Rhizobium freirei PRF 81]